MQFIWFDRDIAFIKIVEKFVADQGVKLFSPVDFDDFVYVVEDLGPEVLIVTWDSVKGNPKHFFDQIKSSPKLSSLPMVIVLSSITNQEWSIYTQGLNVVGTILTPIRPDNIVEMIKKLVMSM